ncbi:transmembrane protein 273-like isoform X1 [Hemibagrus wyckioides]|uniref:transmembrane protein 273-like isoform X1 n=1 Tax=Hemibagrus wyckioides TaxID=337641 RepID=UPI00266BF00E|nr:transmembrane protein 273-like isoform X1 [Hemibagrus wyckioides]
MLDPQRHSFVITFLFVVDTLFIHVKGDDLSPVQEPASEMKYAGIGIGVGLFLSVCFIAIKLYMIKRHMLDNEQSEDSMRANIRSFEVESRT